MRTGKLAEPVLKRSVLRQLNQDKQAVSDRYGMDCAVWPQQTGFLSAYAAAGTLPGFEKHPEKQVTAAMNNLAVGGAVPEALLVQAILPVSYEEAELKADMRKIASAAGEYGAGILEGHTEVTSAVCQPRYLITAIGKVKEDCCSAREVLKPGQDLIVTKWIALAGTAALAIAHEQKLKSRYPFSFIDRAKEFEKMMSVAEDARAINHFGAAAMHDLSQGGIFAALWEMAERAGVGLEVDLKKIPVKQETIEICEYFDINPYQLYSAGALLAGVQQGEAVAAELEAKGIPAAVIGHVTDGNDRIIRNGEDSRFLDRPAQDEWYRKFEG